MSLVCPLFGLQLHHTDAAHLVSNDALQLFLFDIHDRDRQVKLDLVIDRIRDRFGRISLRRASTL